jgi:hypothetical protein
MMMGEVIERLKTHEEWLRGSGDVDEEHLMLNLEFEVVVVDVVGTSPR